ncbi:CDP-glycerol glycerophosphotransferase family protein [Brevibacterium celere]|uniref:CDP-glycerol glycerophosphotransferase family protein n=1 Tax=Brevibacterium celere TaxID=225845 RepID=UPI0031DC9318
MSDQETLLTVVIEAPEPLDRESTTYRRLLAARLQWQDHFNIVVHDKVIRTRDVADLCESSKSRYIVFIRQSHQVSAGFLATLLKYLSKRVVYIAEPLRFNGSIPAKLENIKVDARYHYSRDSDLYGVVLNTGRLRDALEAIGDLDRTALYLAYRLYWSIAKVNPIAAGYSVASDTISAIGYQIDTDYGRLLPLIPAGSTEIRLMVLRYVVLYLRGLRETEATGIKLTDLRETVKTFELISLVSNAEHMHPFECAWIQWLADPQESQILFKQLSDADAYVQFSTDCDEDEPTTVLHTINFRDTILVIGRTYRSRELRAELRTAGHYDFYRRPITTRSTMLFFDRPMQADDNAEYLYSHFVSNNPDYKHVYFALNPKSPDWERLASRGFNLVAFFSSEFYEIFLRSDIVVASQIYNLRYKGKTLANSRFVYLQHGVQLNDMSTWVESKLFDVFVATGKVEADYLKTVAPRETLNSGLPRLESLRRASTNTGDLLFMPTWRFNLHQTSCEMFKSSLYFRAIKAVLTDRDLIDYLERNDITLQVKLHPNIEKRADLFDFSKRVVKSEASYREAISAAAFVFTDYSSAVLDAAFIETPIAYYQWDESSFFADQPYKSRLDYRNTRTGLQSARRHHRAHYSESLSTYCCRLSIPQRTLLRRCGHREDQRENHREDAEPVKNPMRAIRAQVTKSAKNIAYSSPVRNAVRDVVTANYAQPLRDYFEAKGLEDRVRRFTSESLPDGKYFAKLTIKNWQPFAGKPFALSRNGVTVYGNEIEPPAKGFPLEYRNIIVDSTNVDEFDLDIDSPFELLIGRGSFTTPQQVDYDKKYDVRQHGDVYYSLRGNTALHERGCSRLSASVAG